ERTRVHHDEVGVVGAVGGDETVGEQRRHELLGVDSVLRAAERLDVKASRGRHRRTSYRPDPVSPGPVHSHPVDDTTVWCPSCGAEYRAGSTQCADCRVALVNEKPEDLDESEGNGEDEGGLVELGEWPKLQA